MAKGVDSMNRGRCKICQFLTANIFAKRQWDTEVGKALSLRELQTILRVLGCDVSRSTISRHLIEDEGIELYQTRREKIKKAVETPLRKLSGFFIRPTIETPSSKCKHLRTTKFFDMAKERVFEKCLDCGEILWSFDPEAKSRQRPNRDFLIINTLRKKQK